MKNQIIHFVLVNWDWLSPILYGLVLEIALRLWPTKNNVSLIDNLWKIFNKVIPNVRIPQPQDEIIETEIDAKTQRRKQRNKIIANVARHILTVLTLLILINVSVSAQIWQNFKGVRLVNQLEDTANLAPIEGSMFYDFPNHRFLGRTEFGWKPFAASSLPTGTANQYLRLDATGTTPVWQTLSATSPIIFNPTTGIISTLMSQGVLGRTSIGSGVASTLGFGNAIGGSGASINFDGILSQTTQINGANLFDFGFVNIPNSWIAQVDNTLTMSMVKSDSSIILSNYGTSRIGLFPDSITTRTDILTMSIAGNFGTAGQFLGSNGSGSVTWQTPSGGITNTAVNNEIPKSDGTNIISTGIFSSGLGDITLGNPTLIGSRLITTDGNGANVNLNITTKGDGIITNTVGNTNTNLTGSAFSTNNIAGDEGIAIQPASGVITKTEIAGLNPLIVRGRDGDAGNLDGAELHLQGGSAHTLGNNNGADVILRCGIGNGTGTDGDVILETFSKTGTLKLNDGANRQMSTATLVAGTVTVNNPKITTNTRIFLTTQTLGGTIGVQYISGRVPGTSFTITSSNVLDTSTVAWLLIEPN